MKRFLKNKRTGKTLGGVLYFLFVVAWAFCIVNVLLYLFGGATLGLLSAVKVFEYADTAAVMLAIKRAGWFLFGAAAGFFIYMVGKSVKHKED